MQNLKKSRFVQDLLVYGSLTLVAALLIFGFVRGVQTAAMGTTALPIHWHADLIYKVCGEEVDPEEFEAHGELVHGHNDGLVHVEGVVKDPAAVNLAEFLKNAEVNLDATDCDGKPGQMVFYVDGKKVTDPETILIRDGEKIVISFE